MFLVKILNPTYFVDVNGFFWFLLYMQFLSCWVDKTLEKFTNRWDLLIILKLYYWILPTSAIITPNITCILKYMCKQQSLSSNIENPNSITFMQKVIESKLHSCIDMPDKHIWIVYVLLKMSFQSNWWCDLSKPIVASYICSIT